MKKQKLFTAALVIIGLLLPMLVGASAWAEGPATPDGSGVATGETPMVVTAIAVTAVSGPSYPPVVGNVGDLFAYRACSKTNYTDVVAQALNMKSADLRVALVSGQTLNDLARQNNVTLDTIQAAVKTARETEVAQAVKDGVITQAQADYIVSILDQLPDQVNTPNDKATPERRKPGINQPVMPFNPSGYGPNFGAVDHNTVNFFLTAAQTIDVSCATLLVAVQQAHDSIAQFAKSKNIDPSKIVEAMVKAKTDALDQDVKEGLITVAEKSGKSVHLADQLGSLINVPGLWSIDLDTPPCLPIATSGYAYPCIYNGGPRPMIGQDGTTK